MNKISFIILALALCCSIGAHAQSMGQIKSYERLSAINKARPEQNRKHQSVRKVLDAKVLDKTNRVVGQVQDVVLDRSGGINMINVDFDRLRLGIGVLPINYGDLGVRPSNGSYKMSYSDDQLKEMLPSFLNDMSSASGEQVNNFTVSKIMGRDVYAQDGKKIGRVVDVLFDRNGSRAEFLFVNMSERSVRGEKVAIPFASPLYQNQKIIVKNDMAAGMVQYAAEH